MPTKAKVTTMKRSLYIFRLHIHALAKAHLGRGTIYCNLDRQQSSLQITARHKMMLTVLTSSIRLNAMPLWVKSRHQTPSKACLLYPRKRTLMGGSEMSASVLMHRKRFVIRLRLYCPKGHYHVNSRRETIRPSLRTGEWLCPAIEDIAPNMSKRRQC